MTEQVTITDIARLAGVSKTTISRYLNKNYGYMSAETRGRIENIIKENNYVPSSSARTLKSKKSGMIGVIVNTLRYQVGAQTVTGINDVCSHNGFGTIVYCTNDDPDTEAEAIQFCLNQQVEGMIIIPSQGSSDRYAKICDRGIPVIICTRTINDWQYGSVYVRHDALIEKMLFHLKEQGFEKVRFLLDVNNFHKRLMGQSFAKTSEVLFGMSESDSIALVGRETPRIAQALDDFMKEYPDSKKALMAVNTHTLFVLLKEIEQRKLKMPEDIGVCGYDALGWSELVYPGISSIRQPMDQIGIVAATKMIRCISEHQPNDEGTILDGKLFFRRSTQLKD